MTPEWQQPTLSAVELREHRERGSEAAGASPTARTPDLFTIQLYNPDQAVAVRYTPSSWNRTESWEFEIPVETFRLPSASRLDRQQAAATAVATAPLAAAPKNGFRWKRDGRLGNKDMTCYLVGQTVGLQRSKEPDITVALFKHGRDPAVTVYEPNLQRVDVQDRKGLDLVFLLSAQGIRDLYLTPRPDTFNMVGAPAGTGRRKNSRPAGSGGESSSAPAAGHQQQPHATHSGLSVTTPALSAVSGAAASSHGSDASNLNGNKSGVANSAPSAAAIDAQTKRLRTMLEREEKERAKREKEEERRIRKMLETEEKERRLREAEVAKETERLRKMYGVDGQELPSAVPPPPGPPPPSLPLRPVPQPPPPPRQNHGQTHGLPRPVSTGPSSWQHKPSNDSPPSTSSRPPKGSNGFLSNSAAHISGMFTSSSSLSGNRDRSSSVSTDERRRIQKKKSGYF